jgi:hypothetical protein
MSRAECGIRLADATDVKAEEPRWVPRIEVGRGQGGEWKMGRDCPEVGDHHQSSLLRLMVSRSLAGSEAGAVTSALPALLEPRRFEFG